MHSASYSDRSGETTRTLSDYLGWLRRRWWILLVGAMAGLFAAIAITAIQPRSYTATTSVLVRQVGPDTSARVNLDTEAQLVHSAVVASQAKQLMRSSETTTDLLDAVSVQVPPNSQVLEVAYEASKPEASQAGSHAFAQAYLDVRAATAKRNLDTQVAALRQQIADLNKQLTPLAGKLGTLPANSPERQRAEAELGVLTNQLSSLNSRLSPLLATTVDPGAIISDATLPTKPTSPNKMLNLASGLGAGLLLGFALALLLDRLDTRVRRVRDLEERIGLQVLLAVPGKRATPALLPPHHPASRELGRLRNVLLTTIGDPASHHLGAGPMEGEEGQRLLVTAASSGDASGFVVANLAAAFARSGRQVAVLCTTPSNAVAALLGVTARTGLADVLRHDMPALSALAPVPDFPRLRVMVPGNLDPDSELPVSGLLEVVHELSARFDHVVVETGPPSTAVEAQALAPHMHAVLLVAESRRTRTEDVVVALQQFDQVHAPVAGAVLVPFLGRGKFGDDYVSPVGPPPKSPPPVRPPADVPTAPAPRDREPAREAAPAATARGTARAPKAPGDSTMILPKMPEAGPSRGVARPVGGSEVPPGGWPSADDPSAQLAPPRSPDSYGYLHDVMSDRDLPGDRSNGSDLRRPGDFGGRGFGPREEQV